MRPGCDHVIWLLQSQCKALTSDRTNPTGPTNICKIMTIPLVGVVNSDLRVILERTCVVYKSA